MLHATTTDEGLLNLVKDWREDEGWREFYRRYAPAIEAHARRSGLTKEQAEDVVQTTMIKVAKYLPTFEYDRTIGRFRTWLNQIVNQRIIAIWHEQRRTKLPEAAWVYLKEFVAGVVNPAADPMAQAQLEQRMLEVCLARARNWGTAAPLADFRSQRPARPERRRGGPPPPHHYGQCLGRAAPADPPAPKLEWQALLNEPFSAE